MTRPALASVFCLWAAAAFPATASVQSLIDAAAARGGGTVRLAPGTYEVASLELKSNVTLELPAGARLAAITNYSAYADVPGENRGAVVWANGATNVALVGEGTVDGRGGAMPRVFGRPGRWRGVVFYRCRDVRLEGVAIRDAHSWACYLKECEGVTVRGVTIDNHANYNNDGLDIESSDVLVEDCTIDSEDDALVFKTRTEQSRVERVVVRNCRIHSNSSFIKVGTETHGRFRDIVVSNCTLSVTRPISVREPYVTLPGVRGLRTGIAAVDVSIVDGGSLDGFLAKDLVVGEGVMVPVFVRLGRRRRVASGTFLRNVTVDGLRMTEPAASHLTSAVTGVDSFGWGDLSWGNVWCPWRWSDYRALRPADITLRNLDLVLAGDDADDGRAWFVSECAGHYPVAYMFGEDLLPAHAFYVRHADGVRFENVTVRTVGAPSVRPPVVAEDATQAGASEIRCLSPQNTRR